MAGLKKPRSGLDFLPRLRYRNLVPAAGRWCDRAQSSRSGGWLGIQFQQPLFLALMVTILMLFAGNLLDCSKSVCRDGSPSLDLRPRAPPATRATRSLRSLSDGRLRDAAGDAVLRAVSWHGNRFCALTRGYGDHRCFPCHGAGACDALSSCRRRAGAGARLPRPGPWMIRLRRVLGLALLATAVAYTSSLRPTIPRSAWRSGTCTSGGTFWRRERA